MAKVHNKAAAMFLNLTLLLSLLFVLSYGFKTTPVPICKGVHGVKNGDTCFDVTRKFNLTPGEFVDLNPNLVCKKLFIGQWLCVNGIVLS